MNKNLVYIIAIILALSLLPVHHLGYSLGDDLFRLVGLSPWTGSHNNGLHLPVILGIILLIYGISGVVKKYRPQYPKILSRIVIGVIVFFYLFPIVSEKTLFLIKHNDRGISSMHVSTKDIYCSYKTEGTDAEATCKFTVYNYGKEDHIIVKPILLSDSTELSIEFEPVKIFVQPHSRAHFTIPFVGEQQIERKGSGWRSGIGLELEVRGEKRRLE